MKQSLEIDGIIVPHKWSTGNRVAAISICAAGELEYLIDSINKTGKELKTMVGKRVILTGYLIQDDSVPQKLFVESYKIIEW